MKEPYLEVTYRHGRAMAAYLYLPREVGDQSHRTVGAGSGLLVDFNETGKPIGIEITAPSLLTRASLNRVLEELGQPHLESDDLKPLEAA